MDSHKGADGTVMRGSRRIATQTTAFGSVGNTLLVFLQAVLLIPLYLHYIGPRLYGAWLGSGDLLLWIQVVDLGLPNLMIQRIGAAQGRGDNQSVGEWFATGTLVIGVVSLVVTMIGAAASVFLPGWMSLSGAEASQLRSCLLVGVVASGIILLNNSFVGFSRGIQDTAFMNGVLLVSSLASLGTSLVLILSGWGLWALALGLAARAAVALFGSLLFVAPSLKGNLRPFFRIRTPILREFAVACPGTAFGSVSYAVMNHSETALVAILIRPEVATLFNLTRKAADVARGMLDTIGFASYGGFAHLVGSDERHRALHVHAEITSLYLSMAVVAASAYMAVNRSLVTVWVGADQFGGVVLTMLMAAQLIVVGQSYLLNYLYRAAGAVVKGSVALGSECALRFPLMIGLLLWIGLPGLPVAAITTAALSAALVNRWTKSELSAYGEPVRPLPGRLVTVRVALLATGILGGVLLSEPSWGYVLVTGSLIVLVGGSALLAVDPLQKNLTVPALSRAGSLLRWGRETKEER